MYDTLPTETIDAILLRHTIAPPATGERSAHHTKLEIGYELAIAGNVESGGPKTITLTVGTLSQSRSCPLDEDQAREMVERLQEQHAIPHRHSEENTLRHLLLKCSAMYVESEITSFVMNPVYLNEGGYRIDDVNISAQKHMTVSPRLDPHAHDRHAIFAHRPTETR